MVIQNQKRAVPALKYIIPFLEKYNFRWCISGGFACYLYGVKRPISDIDIDIDIEANKDNTDFKSFIQDVKEFTRFPFQHWITVDKNYDNWVMEVVVNGQVLSICTTENLKLLNKAGEYELFYKNGIPDPIMVDFEDLKLPLAPKKSVLRMKQALAYKKAVDLIDISGMQKIIDAENKSIL